MREQSVCPFFIAAALALAPVSVAAQEPEAPIPCLSAPCALDVDWGGPPPGGMDRRYGNAFEFEERLRGHLAEAGYRLTATVAIDDGTVILRLQPEMMRAICDRVPGTGTDMSCQTIGEVRVQVHNVDEAVDFNRSFRIRGRCGADQLMDVARMSQHAAATIVYELAGREGDRPSTRC